MSEKIDYSKGIYDARQLGTGRMPVSYTHLSQSIENEAAMVRRVKSYKAGYVVSDSNLAPTATLHDVLAVSYTHLRVCSSPAWTAALPGNRAFRWWSAPRTLKWSAPWRVSWWA